MPDEQMLKEIAAQLRKPSGDFGREVGAKMNESNLAMNLKTIEKLEISEDDQVLEIGMGNGFFVKEILSKHISVNYVGCDYSSDMVKESRTNNARFVNENRASFYRATAENLPIDDRTIDKLFTVNTLYFWEDKTLILSELKRVLKKNGVFIIAIRPDTCMHQYPSTQYNFEYFSSIQVEHLLSEHGFEVLLNETFEEPEVEILEKKIIPEYCIIKATIVT